MNQEIKDTNFREFHSFRLNEMSEFSDMSVTRDGLSSLDIGDEIFDEFSLDPHYRFVGAANLSNPIEFNLARRR